MSSTTLTPTFRKLQKELSETAIQQLLYLQLLDNIIQTFPAQSQTHHASPTSAYFFDGQRPPMKHASLILRMIKNKKLPTVTLKPKNSDELIIFLDHLWQRASMIAQSDAHTVSEALKTEALCFIQIGLQLDRVCVKTPSSTPLLFELETDSGLARLFEALWRFGLEYYTFCLERI